MTTQAPLESVRSRNDTSVIVELLKVNARLTEQIIELSRLVANVQAPQVNTPMESFANIMHVPETEEDAQYAYNSGQLDKEGLEEALKEIGFYNAEITIPS